MSKVGDVKPWFKEDFARILMSIYFASFASSGQIGESNEQYRAGFAAALSSIAIMIGVNPESFLTAEDIRLIKKNPQTSLYRWID